MKKNFWLIITVFLVFLSLITVPAKANTRALTMNEPPQPVLTSKVATYNMAAGIGTDGDYDLERIADTIRQTGADIIGLQEVDVHWSSRSDHENTIKRLAEILDMHYFFAPIYDEDPLEEGEPRKQYGVAVLSHYPIVKAHNREITRLSTQEPDPKPKMVPGFLEAKIKVGDEDIWFYVTHLDYRSDPSIRTMQIEDMFEYLSEHPYSILVGDLNATPEAPELEPLFQWLKDGWRAADDEQGFTFPADAPEKRIDYVLTSPRMKSHSASITDSTASDHLPVTAEIEFLGETSESTDNLQRLTEELMNLGWVNEEAYHDLQLHLTVLNHFEAQKKTSKLVKHLESMRLLLDFQREEEQLNERAYVELFQDVTALIKKWE